MKNQEIKILANEQDLFQFAAEDFCQRVKTVINTKNKCTVVLSGGNTPKSFFDTLAVIDDQKLIPWQQIQFFFGDERYVPFDDERSNYNMAHAHLFSKVPVNLNNVYRIHTEFSIPKTAAEDYENTLRKIFHIDANAFPEFDLMYLGLGDNAHTASLMPESDVVKEYVQNPLLNKNRLVTSLFVEEQKMYRITLTPNAINNAREIIFLVSGANKADTVHEVLEGTKDPIHYPAQIIHSMHGKTNWYLDKPAAQKLKGK